MSDEFRSGFVAILGRPNVGKSMLLNALMGRKVTIVSKRPNTTRRNIRGILTDAHSQIVFVDTPGIHRPRTPLGARLNDAAHEASGDVDLQLIVVDATAKIGPGDRRVLESAPETAFAVVNKCDIASPAQIAEQLTMLQEFPLAEYFPVSARSRKGIPELLAAIRSRMSDPYQYYPDEMYSDQEETAWIADLVREGFLHVLEKELPHSIACRVTEMSETKIRVEILVERESQKPIVIGRGGETLKQVGSRVRRSLPQGVYLELFVRVAKNWQSDPRVLDQLGL